MRRGLSLSFRTRTSIAVLNTILEATPIALDTFFILSGFPIIVRFILHTKFGDSPRLELAAAPFALAISFGIAKLSWKYLESPLIRRGQSYILKLAFQALPATP